MLERKWELKEATCSDSLLSLKNEEQNPLYSKDRYILL